MVADDVEDDGRASHAVLAEHGDTAVEAAARRLVLVEEVPAEQDEVHLRSREEDRDVTHTSRAQRHLIKGEVNPHCRRLASAFEVLDITDPLSSTEASERGVVKRCLDLSHTPWLAQPIEKYHPGKAF